LNDIDGCFGFYLMCSNIMQAWELISARARCMNNTNSVVLDFYTTRDIVKTPGTTSIARPLKCLHTSSWWSVLYFQ